MEIPHFVYHPDPIATGALIYKSATCPCCNQQTEVVYAITPYGEIEVDDLCPQCIANGSAARRFGVSFSDEFQLSQAGIDQDIIDEVTLRTPGYISWQGEVWLDCCNDACEFHGDLSQEEFFSLDPDTVKRFRDEQEINDNLWESMIKSYSPGGSLSIYKFICRHCQSVKLGWDCT